MGRVSKKGKIMNIDFSNVEPFIAPHSNITPTEEELAKRERKNMRLKKLGIDPELIIDKDEDVQETSFIIEAMVYINRDEEVPEELLKKIDAYNKEHNIKVDA